MERSDDVLRGLLAAAPDALLAADVEGRIVFVSDQAEVLFGWTREELVGEHVERLIPVRFRSGHPRLRLGFMQHPSTRPMGAGLALRGQRKDGTEFPAEISLSGFSAADDTFVAVAIRDVTEARRNEQRFRAVLASAPDAIVGVDEDGRIELINGQAERLFGWTAAELIGQQVEMLVPEALTSRHGRHRASYMSDPLSRPMGAGLQLSARRKDGSSFPAEISLSAVTEDERTSLILAAVRDVTDRVELEGERRRQALEAQREQSHRLESLGQLAGGVAHDFNNLLGVILNYSTLLARRIDDPVARADIDEIMAAAERAAALTRQLLAFARRDVANPEALDVNDVVREFSSLLERTLGEHVELRLDLTPAPLIVLIDRHQLEQILLNLALNGRDAMSAGGALAISTAIESGADDDGSPHVVMDVADTGRGMDRDVLSRAFEPFFTTKPVGEGTGLGLATVYGIVHQNSGQVTIESESGRGTRVSVRLPLISGEPTRPAGPRTGAQGGRERVLLVEDEKGLRVATSRILEEHGYEVVVACDGVEALEVLDRPGAGVDVVVTDIAMPRMRGDELARILSLRPSAPRVVFMSGYDSAGSPDVGRVLEKPVREVDLLEAIREALDE